MGKGKVRTKQHFLLSKCLDQKKDQHRPQRHLQFLHFRSRVILLRVLEVLEWRAVLEPTELTVLTVPTVRNFLKKQGLVRHALELRKGGKKQKHRQQATNLPLCL